VADLCFTLLTTLVKLTAVIKTFADKSTKEFWGHRQEPGNASGESTQHCQEEAGDVALSRQVGGLANPSRHRLEQLHRDRAGKHSIRINDQFRVCFVWRDGDAYEVEITDYH